MNICSQPEQNKVEEFKDEFSFLSNFYPAPLMYRGIAYPTSEHAYQAAKCLDDNSRLNISILGTPGQSKRYGRTVALRPDWEDVKLEIMENIVRAKFMQNPSLRVKLLLTEDLILEEGNTWGDTYWGICGTTGKNHLGKILMKVREDLKSTIKERT